MQKQAQDTLANRVIIPALLGVIDPEVGINIVDLGLVYRIAVGAEKVQVDMTLTTPACPMGSHLVAEVRAALQAQLNPSTTLDVRLVWEPPWSPKLMSEKARLILGLK